MNIFLSLREVFLFLAKTRSPIFSILVMTENLCGASGSYAFFGAQLRLRTFLFLARGEVRNII